MYLAIALLLGGLALWCGLRWVEMSAANEPKKLLIARAGHNVFGSAGPAYLDQVEQFIRGAVIRDALANANY